MTTTIDLASCLAAIPDRRRAEGKIYGQVGVIGTDKLTGVRRTLTISDAGNADF
jgi:hypothetical protein